jgi:D-alanyl-D-alanine carboxypeptidase
MRPPHAHILTNSDFIFLSINTLNKSSFKIQKAMTNQIGSLQAILNSITDGKKVFGTSFSIKKDSQIWHGWSGNMTKNQSYFIASTTKLFTTAIIMQLRAAGNLMLEDKICQFLDQSQVKGLHTFHGKDYTCQITIKQLLSHTSGLPDYFQGKDVHGKSLEDQIIQGHDQSWSFEEAVERSRGLKPHFIPGTSGKAHYSDTNFQLLGKIIENATGLPYAKNCELRIFNQIGLKNTYLYQDENDKTPISLYYKGSELHIPKAMTSFGPDGGMVSTSEDTLVFIEAFFTGRLFSTDYLEEMRDWKKIFFPLQSGTGIHLFKLPWIFNPLGTIPHFTGHSGLSGALAYYCPKENIYIAGTVNQVAHPDLSFRTMIKLVQAAKKIW